jgi:RNA polymerase sigma factor (sigma-70 family)
MNELVTDNQNLVHAVIHKFYEGRDEYDDLFQIGCIGLWKAAERYDPSRAKFSTFATKYIFNAIGCYLRKKHLATVPLETGIGEGLTIADTITDRTQDVEGVLTKIVISENLKYLSKKQLIILNLMLLGYGTTGIAQMLKVSKQNISALQKIIRNKLR